ncbi:glycine betaine ABC transporter substrate-binding protein [Homoserinibacter sp. YIM 151385]|uniref:glycine betaine ABC transporter substrate-binding protein n=1 Tax=Homoserinibacter sp. YIM 151385 TaxID=2985506 RepID=UPI0022F022ED|nr:glycine betaine ABC transporter substrate-binding protein [Homoserinibacter sp. YIM 151385]WBU39047.1 glycine betaine ABC transporter substrate-binding protein [Homoserinibacter sp. YIM 151385]
MTKRTAHLRRTAVIGGAAVLALGLAACSTGTEENSGGEGDLGTITLGFIPSWTDGLSTAYLLEDQLEKLGYTVEMETLTEAAPLYAGLSNGDVDMYPSAWPEVTHAKYMEQFGDDIEDLGAYYDNAVLTIAVPTYTDIDSIEDLAGNADMFDGKIYGIEPGAGLTGVTQDSMMPEYGLDGDYELVTSSTAAMLTELQGAIDKQEDVVVTLWKPFWANAAFDIKTLEDPKGAMGDAEALHFLGTDGFADEFPEAAEYIAGIKLDDAAYGALEDMVVNEYGEGREAEAIDAWIAEHGDAYEGILAD